MIVVCDDDQKQFVEGPHRLTSGQLSEHMTHLTGAFAVVPPLTFGAESALAQYVCDTPVVAFILFRGVESLDLIRLAFGEEISLVKPSWEDTSLSKIPALSKYMALRKVERVIQFASVDVSIFGSLFDVDNFVSNEEVPGEALDTTGDGTPITPLATLGKSGAVCAGAIRLGEGIVVLVPLGEGIDRDDVAFLEQTARALMRRRGRKCLWVSWQDPDRPTIAIDGGDPRQVGHQPAAILTALWMGQGVAKLADIHSALDHLGNLRYPAVRAIKADAARETDNRIQKLNSLLKSDFGLPIAACTSHGKRDQTRVISPKIDLHVTDLPFK